MLETGDFPLREEFLELARTVENPVEYARQNGLTVVTAEMGGKEGEELGDSRHMGYFAMSPGKPPVLCLVPNLSEEEEKRVILVGLLFSLMPKKWIKEQTRKFFPNHRGNYFYLVPVLRENLRIIFGE